MGKKSEKSRDVCVCVTESLYRILETDTRQEINYTSIKKKKTYQDPPGPAAVVQWLKGAASIPGWGTKIPHATRPQNLKKKEKRKKKDILSTTFEHAMEHH